MIIICSGPDTYRAREKARELTSAFRAKHDPQGLATETLDGSEGLPLLLSRLGSASLFTPKKMLRADGCLAKMKIADVRTLAARLEKDKDNTIVLTVEEEAPNGKTLDALKVAPIFHYPFAYQVGLAFKRWLRERAVKVGVNEQVADKIAEFTEGDSWSAVQELEKQAANPQELGKIKAESGSVFDLADNALSERSGWRVAISLSDDENKLGVCLAQVRNFLRVRDGHFDGMHPYAVKKLQYASISRPEEKFSKFLRAFLASRNSLSTENENEALI